MSPTIPRWGDVIQLNVGGSTNIAVLRRTLTQFEDSMLAAKFSGRWDDSLEKDRDGNIFVDQNPENFLRLIDYLRLRNNRSRQVTVRRPKPTYEFCCMLEYYDLMPSVYPQKWIGNSDNFSCEEESCGTLVLTTKKAEATVLHDFGEFADAGVSEFTVIFEKGTTGAVGWLDFDKDTDKDSPYSHLLDGFRDNQENSIVMSITERKIFGPDKILEENMRIDHMVSTTKITCRHDELGEYSIEAVDVSPPGGIATTLKKSRVVSTGSYLSSKVTVSGLKYRIDHL